MNASNCTEIETLARMATARIHADAIAQGTDPEATEAAYVDAVGTLSRDRTARAMAAYGSAALSDNDVNA